MVLLLEKQLDKITSTTRLKYNAHRDFSKYICLMAASLRVGQRQALALIEI